MDIDVVSLKSHSVKQGKLVEFIAVEDVLRHNKKFGHLFFVTFDNKKVIRGNHYHKKHHEYYIALAGSVKVLLKDLNTNKKKTITLSAEKGTYKRLRIGPNIAHAAYSTSRKANMLAYYGDPYNPKKLDTYHYQLIADK